MVQAQSLLIKMAAWPAAMEALTASATQAVLQPLGEASAVTKLRILELFVVLAAKEVSLLGSAFLTSIILEAADLRDVLAASANISVLAMLAAVPHGFEFLCAHGVLASIFVALQVLQNQSPRRS